MADGNGMWRRSLLFRRIVVGSVFVLATGLVYLGSHIPRAMPLPDKELTERAKVRLGDEQFLVMRPQLAQGDVALSYVGNKNEVAELFLENATLDDTTQRLLFAGKPAPAAGKVSYTVAETPSRGRTEDTCHTTIEIRRAKDSPEVRVIQLFQNDETAGPQRFRQVVFAAPGAVMEIEVHTDAPEEGAKAMAECHRLLTVGGSRMDVPALPLHFLVQGGKVDLHFNSAVLAVSVFTGEEQTFEAVSLGDGTLRAANLQVVSTQTAKTAKLEVHNRDKKGLLTLKSLKLGSDWLKLDVGRDPEEAMAYVGGKSLWNFDLIDWIQKNPILSFAFAAVVVPAVLKWVQKNCFPGAEALSGEVGKGV